MADLSLLDTNILVYALYKQSEPEHHAASRAVVNRPGRRAGGPAYPAPGEGGGVFRDAVYPSRAAHESSWPSFAGRPGSNGGYGGDRQTLERGWDRSSLLRLFGGCDQAMLV